MALGPPAMQRRALLGAALSAFLEACSSATRPPAEAFAPTRGARAGGDHHALSLPPRPSSAPSGSAFVAECAHLSAGERELAIGREILAGNVPSFLRALARVPVGDAGQKPRAFVWVTRDYLAIGSDTDFVRIPMAKRMAHKIAGELGCFLPTARIVDAIYLAASCKIVSPAHGASAEMASTELYAIHNAEIEDRRRSAGCPADAVVAGPKKDLVISAREAEKPGHLAIYGWFHEDGTPIQPLSLLHSERYVDFSHGIRLVSERMEVDGETRALVEVLRDPALASLVSSEGAFAPVEPM